MCDPVAMELQTQLAQWRRIVIDLTRCEHGRVQGDVCYGCPDGWSPSQEGREVGYSLDGTFRLVVPSRALADNPAAWYKEA